MRPPSGWNQPEQPPRPADASGRARHSFDDPARGPRLHKVLALAGVASRRACETLIEDGAVTVNGHIIDRLPAWVDPMKDHIEVNGRRISRPEKPVYVMLNKPRGVVCTNADDADRRAIDLVQHPDAPRLYPVGRLDADSSGLLLLTNDGGLANRLTHPRYGVHKTYEVVVEGALDAGAVKKLERGIFLPGRGGRRGGRTKQSSLELIRTERDRTHLRLELREGRNRQIRRMMLRVGHPVRRLQRISLGPLRLRDLRPGQWRELSPRELQALQNAGRSGDAPRTGSRAGSKKTTRRKAPGVRKKTD